MAEILKDTTNNTIGTGDGGLQLDPSGTEVVTINNGVVIPDGTKSEPAIRLSDDTNTGIYSPTNDSISFVGNGSDVIQAVGAPSGVNYAKVTSSATTADVALTVDGSDVNSSLAISGKGTGTVKVNGLSLPTADGTNGQVLTTDGAGGLTFQDAGGGGGASALPDLSDVTISTPAVTARYWRLNITENFGDASFVGAKEIQLREAVSGADVTGSGTAIGSTNQGASFDYSKAFDNDTGTQWYTLSGNPTGWIGYDFGAGNEKTIVEYTILPPALAGRQPKTWSIDYSHDGSNWTTVYSETTQTEWASFEERTFSANNTATSNPVKGDLLAYNGTDWINIGVGADGQLLTVDSAENTGMAWQTLAGSTPGYLYSGTVTTAPLGTGEDTLVIGDGANANDGDNCVVIGAGASNAATRDRNVVIGYNAGSGNGSDNVIIGTNAAGSIESIVLGKDTTGGGQAVTIGNNITSTCTSSIVIGTATSAYTIGYSPNSTIIGPIGASVTGGAEGVTIVGGWLNSIPDATLRSSIVGGQSNTINSTHNDNNTARSQIFGGNSNSITGSACGSIIGSYSSDINSSAVNAGIFSAKDGLASNTNATVLGGDTNTASGNTSTVINGNNNIASGTGSTVLYGRNNTCSAVWSSAGGRYASSPAGIRYAHTQSGGRFAADGDSQVTTTVIKATTSDATQTNMNTDGTDFPIASDQTVFFTVKIAARRTDVDGESAAYEIKGCIDNNAGTTALVGTPTVTTIGEDTAAWDVTASADDTNDKLLIQVTGEASKTIRWVGQLTTVEVTG